MDRFLSNCAQYIYKKHYFELHQICLVFPNRRAAVFFNSYLQKHITGAVISPHMTQVNELISGYSDIPVGEQLNLISILYKIFRKHTNSSESFDDFYYWGEALLSDFNDIDNYLADAHDLYRNISGLKDIESHFFYLTEDQKEAIARFWNCLERVEKKGSRDHFVSIWSKLYPVYRDFKKELEIRGFGYNGMICRRVIEKLKTDQLQLRFSKYYIIGLNALNRCEEEFFKYLKKESKAEFLWDYNQYYLDDKINSAGLFIRRNLETFPPPGDFKLKSSPFEENKKIKVISVSSANGQSQAVPRFLEDTGYNADPQFDSTAVVLADESLLLPTLSVIPPKAGEVNVTMGYPVTNSVIYGLINLLVNLIKNRKISPEGETIAYHRYVTDILRHQILVNIESEKVNLFLEDIKKNNRLNIPLREIDFSPLHVMIFNIPGRVIEYCSYFLKILSGLYETAKSAVHGSKLLQELIYRLYESIEKLQSMVYSSLTEGEIEISDSVFFRLFRQYVGKSSVAYEGEPLTGIQVMGILETRCLDFRNIIILGFNENKWPRTSTAPSFIPYNLRRGFGLPGPDEQDAMYAYYFYRLIQRADNITAVYSTAREDFGAGELSRYGYQLLYDSKLDVKTGNLVFPFSNDPPEPIVVQNRSIYIKSLRDRNSYEKPLSPTAINTFLKCSLRFYFRYILQLPEPEEIKDEIDSPLFGSIFHEATEQIYKPFIGKTVQKSDLENLRKNKDLLESILVKAISKLYYKEKGDGQKGRKPEGKTVLIFENAKTFLDRILELDMHYAPFKIISLEEDYYTSVNIMVQKQKEAICLGGKIDRVDNINGTTRVLDYKTGNVESFSFDEVGELFDKDKDKPKKELLQALLYSFFLKEKTGCKEPVQPVIYSLKKFFDNKFSPEIKYQKQPVYYQDIEEEFTGHLKELIADIFSEETTFRQTSDIEFCRYCPFKKICQRF
ncbi:MAG: PD-(D/E)XK nuclease family protein [Prolixibacteraceae bacterium]|nr:PD-(D/E)XK nuclease family protein [Prolixibacteraceae bacterium]